MLPKGFLVGNVAADPQSGISQASQKNYSRFSVACDDRFIRSSESNRTHFFNLVSWGKTASFIQEFVRKGDKVFVEFTISTSSYVNQEGKTVRSIDFFVDNIEKISSRSPAKTESSLSDDSSGGEFDESGEDIDSISLSEIF